MSIKSVLDSLPAESKRCLMHAFEHQFAQHVKLEGGKFIGVNINKGSNLIVEEQAGVWSYGTIKQGD